MIKKILPLVLSSAALLMSSCHEQSEQIASFFSSSSPKPIVALVPVIDNSHHDLSWNLSDEFTYTICERLVQKDQLYLIDEQKVRATTKKLSDQCDPFNDDLGWVKKVFSHDEFVVFLELVDHQEAPVVSQRKSPPSDSPAELTMTMRVRVVDIRGEQPKIILQELIHDSHHIPKQFNRFNFSQVAWGETSYSISPLGLAHAQLSKEIATRITDYILLMNDKK